MIKLDNKLKKIAVFSSTMVAILFLIAAMSGAKASPVEQVDTTTEFLTLNTIDVNPPTTPVAFPPESPVEFTGEVLSDPTVPVGTAINIRYRLEGTTTWTTATTNSPILTAAGGLFSGTFTAPSASGNYEFQAVFPNVNEASSGNYYHWHSSHGTVIASVLPEYALAGLAAMLSCFGAFIVYKKGIIHNIR